MRVNRDKWHFISSDSKHPLSWDELNYFKRSLEKLLKIGMEFEYNLPEKNGKCKGDSNSCPCVRMSQHNCWERCSHLDTCMSVPDILRCSNRKTTCLATECATCTSYKLQCNSLFCTDYMPNCYLCPDFETDCAQCPHKFDPGRNPEAIRSNIIKELAPNQCYGYMNESGVHSITTDGSLLGNKGIEVITIGRRIDYWEFYKMAKRIIQSVTSRGAYVNERCSIHMHLLASYYGKLFQGHDAELYGIPDNISELEKPIPQIVLANFHQLVRKYQNALVWMGMALDQPNHMTRWEKFRVSILEISAILNSMRGVQEEVSRNSGGNKYGFVNYKFCDFNDVGDITRFHLEMRGLDGMSCPSAVASFACLYYALAIKAIEISRHGVVEVGDSTWFNQAKSAKRVILNNMKGYQDGDRFGDTSHIHDYEEYFKEEALELIRQLKHILIQIGPAYDVLEQLALKPISYRRCEGQSWEEIENTLAIHITEESKLENSVNEYIDMRIVDSCTSMTEWTNAVSEAIRQDNYIDTEIPADLEDRIHSYIGLKIQNGDIIWSEKIGAAIAL